MGFWRKAGKISGTFVNVRIDQWLGVDLLKNHTAYFIDRAKGFAKLEQGTQAEGFEDAVQRLGLNEADLARQLKTYLKLSLFFIVLAISVFFYSFYMLIHFHNIIGFCIGLSLTFYAFSQSFRYHFWYFQIKKRKLGCTFYEWLNGQGNT